MATRALISPSLPREPRELRLALTPVGAASAQASAPAHPATGRAGAPLGHRPVPSLAEAPSDGLALVLAPTAKELHAISTAGLLGSRKLPDLAACRVTLPDPRGDRPRLPGVPGLGFHGLRPGAPLPPVSGNYHLDAASSGWSAARRPCSSQSIACWKPQCSACGPSQTAITGTGALTTIR